MAINRGHAAQSNAVGPGIIVPLARFIVCEEEADYNHSGESQQPDDEVRGDKRTRMHTLPAFRKKRRSKFGDDDEDRETGLSCIVSFSHLEQGEGQGFKAYGRSGEPKPPISRGVLVPRSVRGIQVAEREADTHNGRRDRQ